MAGGAATIMPTSSTTPATTPTARPPVLFIGRDLAGGGAERVQLQLTQALRDHFQVTVYYMTGEGPLAALIPPGVEVVYGRIGKKFSPAQNLQSLRDLLRLARSSALLFGMQDTTPVYLSSVLGKVMRRPTVGWIHNTWSRKKTEVPRVHGLLVRLLYPLVDRFVAVSGGAARSLAAEVPGVGDRIEVVFNPIDRALLLEQAQAPIPPEHEAMFAGTTFIGIGRLETVKGFDLLIEAFSRLPAGGHRLVIVGDGSQAAELRALAQRLGVADRVHFTGFVRNPYPYLNRADVFVLSSHFEGLPTVLVEALLLQKPAIATDCESGPREILDGGRHGWLVPTGSADGLHAAMQRYLEHPEELQTRARMNAEGHDRFEPGLVAARFSEVFRSVMGQGARPGMSGTSGDARAGSSVQ